MTERKLSEELGFGIRNDAGANRGGCEKSATSILELVTTIIATMSHSFKNIVTVTYNL